VGDSGYHTGSNEEISPIVEGSDDGELQLKLLDLWAFPSSGILKRKHDFGKLDQRMRIIPSNGPN
jgi:hypothetical protein